MADITAAAVKTLREETGCPMMECKKALQESNGDAEAARDWLRKRGAQVGENRAGRETAFGRFGIHADVDSGVGAMVEVQCESAPVTKNAEFIAFADGLAKQLATGPGASSAGELLAQPDPENVGQTLGELKDDLFNRVREVFNVGRMIRIDSPCGAYSHNAATVAGVLLAVTGGNSDAVKDICMHIAAMRPKALTPDDLDADIVAKEKEILTDTARSEGKPENIIEKMVEGRMRNFYAQSVLTEQSFVKDDKVSVGQFAKDNGFEIKSFVHWELGVA